jgi:hypothetical protein
MAWRMADQEFMNFGWGLKGGFPSQTHRPAKAYATILPMSWVTKSTCGAPNNQAHKLINGAALVGPKFIGVAVKASEP